jgi:hypothetical protein
MEPLTKDIIDLIPELQGTDCIRKCWGDVPPYRWSHLLHLSQSGPCAEQKVMLTALFWTHGPEDINECKPSRILIEFCGVVYWESGSGLAEENGIPLGDMVVSPPPGTTVIHLNHDFYAVYHKARVVSCVRESFS